MKKLAIATAAALVIAAPMAFAQSGTPGRSGQNSGGSAAPYPGTAQKVDPSKPSATSIDEDRMNAKMGKKAVKTTSKKMKRKATKHM